MPRPPAQVYEVPPLGCKSKVRAMAGVCPIPINKVGLPLSHPQLLGWFLDVRGWGLKRKEFLTKDCIIGWLRSILPFDDELIDAQDILEDIAPEDPVSSQA